MTDEPIETDDPEVRDRLQRERPAPDATFRGELGRAVAADPRARGPHRPARLWMRVGGLALAGTLAFGVALLLV